MSEDRLQGIALMTGQPQGAASSTRQALSDVALATLVKLRADTPFYALCLGFTLLCGALCLGIGAADLFEPFMYVGRWVNLLGLLGAIGLVYLAVRSLRHERGLTHLRDLLCAATPQWVAGACLCIGLAVLHGSYTTIKAIAPTLRPLAYDRLFADWDLILHGRDPWLLLTWLNPFTDGISWAYSVVWLTMIFLVTVIAVTSNRLTHLRSQYVWTFAISWIVLGNILSTAALAAGPVYYEQVLGDRRFAALTTYMASHDPPYLAHILQERLWSSYQDGLGGIGRGISAFPSMHVSMVTLLAIWGFRVHLAVGLALAAFAGFILLGSVHLAWHYAVDGYASIIATALIWFVVGRVLSSRAAKMRPSDQLAG